MKWLLVLALVLVGVAYAAAQDENDNSGGDNTGDGDNQGDGDNTGGGDDNGGNQQASSGGNQPASAFDGETVCQMTPKIRKTILKVHNDLRTRCATGEDDFNTYAGCMNKLEWSDDLEEAATKYASNGVFKHDDVTKVYFKKDKKEADNGENMGMAELALEPDFGGAVKQMYTDEQKKLLNAGAINPYTFGFSYGHISQICWARTARVGCGIGFIKNYQNRGVCLLICKYNPPGNYGGSNMMEAADSTAGDKCATGTDSEFTALCNTPSYITDPSDSGSCQ